MPLDGARADGHIRTSSEPTKHGQNWRSSSWSSAASMRSQLYRSLRDGGMTSVRLVRRAPMNAFSNVSSMLLKPPV